MLILGEMMSGPRALALLKEELNSLHKADIVLSSAYIKAPALLELEKVIAADNVVRVLARWTPCDLINGASDLECYSLARKRGWKFVVRQDLHAKVYCVGKKSIFLGSANLTRSGFGLGIFGNEEAVVCVAATGGNLGFSERLFDGGTEITDELFLKIEQYVLPRLAAKKASSESGEDWPIDIKKDMDPVSVPRMMLVSECFWTDGAWLFDNSYTFSSPENEALHHDVSLLGCQSVESLRGMSQEEISNSVAHTRILRWLTAQLQGIAEREMYFGEITARLHDALVNDPKPYRREVKDMVKNIYGWIKNAKVARLAIDQPNHSERIRYIS